MAESTDPPPVRRPWSTPARVVLGVAGALLTGTTGLFLGAVFLHVAPANSLSREYREQVDGLIYPEFEQNWKLFAPNPLQQNIAVDARVRTGSPDGADRIHEWVGLTARDIAAIRGNPAPSHADQNLLRRAWDFYDGSHSAQDESATNPRGALAEEYLKRIAVQRIGPSVDGRPVVAVELRVTSTTVAPPVWSEEAAPAAPKVRELPWWPVKAGDLRGLR
ncbi:DUF5819 family protein [Kitasatospora purpeofusca]|uniref:DUF5819 family protein n=1 Tax=Kitasatospora purpeofusca TaxID=67352 RepID=UPI00386FCD17|nr:DUF5819 family protein [Kitasatospora purpeofusca]